MGRMVCVKAVLVASFLCFVKGGGGPMSSGRMRHLNGVFLWLCDAEELFGCSTLSQKFRGSKRMLRNLQLKQLLRGG